MLHQNDGKGVVKYINSIHFENNSYRNEGLKKENRLTEIIFDSKHKTHGSLLFKAVAFNRKMSSFIVDQTI